MPQRKKIVDGKGRTTRAGGSKLEALARRRLFVRAYLSNGRNGAAAAISAGFSAKNATVAGSRLLAESKVAALIAEATKEYEQITGLEQTRTLKEIARVAYFDPARAYHQDGTPKHVLDMDADTRAVIAGEKIHTTMAGDQVVATVTERKFLDKNAALDKAMRFHGLYEKDNEQKDKDYRVTIRYVG